MSRARWLTVAVVTVFLAFPAASLAATWTVNTTADNTPTGSECSGAPGDCSIRQAANRAASGDTIVIPASASPYLVAVANGFIVIPGGVTVMGAGASQTTVSGQGTSQIFEVDTAGTTTFEKLTLANANNNTGKDEAGAITANQGGSPTIVVTDAVFSNDVSHEFGGAIEQSGSGSLTVSDSSFVNDTATSDGGGAIDYYSSGTLAISNSVFTGDADFDGGAILVETAPAASTINASTFSGDSASGTVGGAIATETGNGVKVYNSTFTGNSAKTAGGGIDVAESPGKATLVNDTDTANTAPTGANLNSSGTLSLQNTIISNPKGGGANCAGTVTSNGNNLEDTSPSSCGLSAAKSDLIGTNPQLASTLAANRSTVPTAGGPPQTLALSSTSPALGAASSAGCTTVGGVDERTFSRPDPGDSHCDIGAFELQFPRLSALKVRPRKFVLAGRRVKGRCVKRTHKNAAKKHCRRPIKLGVSYTLNVAATVTFTLNKRAPGRKVKGRCVKPTHKNHTHGKCTRLISVHGTITQSGKAGTNQFTFNGKIGGHRIGPGTYQLTATPSADTAGTPTTVTFKIVS